jgi:hypothetical protein
LDDFTELLKMIGLNKESFSKYNKRRKTKKQSFKSEEGFDLESDFGDFKRRRLNILKFGRTHWMMNFELKK